MRFLEASPILFYSSHMESFAFSKATVVLAACHVIPHEREAVT